MHDHQGRVLLGHGEAHRRPRVQGDDQPVLRVRHRRRVDRRGGVYGLRTGVVPLQGEADRHRRRRIQGLRRLREVPLPLHLGDQHRQRRVRRKRARVPGPEEGHEHPPRRLHRLGAHHPDRRHGAGGDGHRRRQTLLRRRGRPLRVGALPERHIDLQPGPRGVPQGHGRGREPRGPDGHGQTLRLQLLVHARGGHGLPPEPVQSLGEVPRRTGAG